VKQLLFIVAVSIAPSLAWADWAKHAAAPATPRKLGSEARVYVVEKDVPSLDKTVKLARAPLPATKDK
jgi:hypothetical protein